MGLSEDVLAAEFHLNRLKQDFSARSYIQYGVRLASAGNRIAVCEMSHDTLMVNEHRHTHQREVTILVNHTLIQEAWIPVGSRAVVR